MSDTLHNVRSPDLKVRWPARGAEHRVMGRDHNILYCGCNKQKAYRHLRNAEPPLTSKDEIPIWYIFGESMDWRSPWRNRWKETYIAVAELDNGDVVFYDVDEAKHLRGGG